MEVGKGSTSPRAPARDPLAGFAEFWNAYGLKKAKAAAERVWRKLAPDADLAALLTARAATYVAGLEDRKFQPHAATWLNGRRWEDELAAALPGRPARNMTFSAVGESIRHDPSAADCPCSQCVAGRARPAAAAAAASPKSPAVNLQEALLKTSLREGVDRVPRGALLMKLAERAVESGWRAEHVSSIPQELLNQLLYSGKPADLEAPDLADKTNRAKVAKAEADARSVEGARSA